MEIKVASGLQYKEVTASTVDATIKSGPLDAPESIAMAKELIYVAEQLLPVYMANDAKEMLAKIRETL